MSCFNFLYGGPFLRKSTKCDTSFMKRRCYLRKTRTETKFSSQVLVYTFSAKFHQHPFSSFGDIAIVTFIHLQ